MVRLGLRARLLAGLAFLTLAALGSAGAVALWAAESLSLENERQFGAALVHALSFAKPPGISLGEAARGWGELLERARASAGSQEISVTDADGKVVASTDGLLVGTFLREQPVALALQTREGSFGPTAFGTSYAHPILDGGRVLGCVRVVMKPMARAALGRARMTIVLLIVADALFLLVVGAWLLGSFIIRPLERVRGLARRVSAGDFGTTVPVEGVGEMADLTHAANEMSLALREHVERAQHSREQLIRSEKLASIGRLAAGIAHEVGNPLGAIMGYAEVLRDPNVTPEDRRDLAERISRDTGRIHEILRGLLDYARPRPASIERVQIADVLEDALSLVTHHKRWSDIELVRDLPADLPPVAANASRLGQVLVNLLFNAADAMEGRGRIRISATREGERVVLRVSDTGPGIPEELRTRVFEPFVTTKAPGDGTGLGLAICQSIIDSLGGTIAVADPGEEKGATFEVTLPIHAEHGSSPTGESTLVPGQSNGM